MLNLKHALEDIGQRQITLAKHLKVSSATVSLLINHRQWPRTIPEADLRAGVEQFLKEHGADEVAVGIDARDGRVRVRGWKDDSGVSALDLALQMKALDLRTVIFTDVSRDGLGSGLNIPSTRALAESSGLDVIASGGVHTLEDVIAARDARLAGAIVGRALYEGTISTDCLRQNG